MRNPVTQVAYIPGSEPALFLGRGYTGHEHLPWFGLINMNARLYDAALGRFLSLDTYVQMPDFSQNFNRYSYCLNNPLVYIDQDGEFWWFFAAAFLLFTEPGYQLQKYISPVAVKIDLRFGTHQKAIGFDVSVGIPKMMPIAGRLEYGKSYFWKNYGDYKGWETRKGFEVSAMGLFTYSKTHYKAGEFTQTVGRISLGIPSVVGIDVSNDLWGDGGDRFRTSHVRINAGPFRIGQALFTGDPGLEGEDRWTEEINGKRTYVKNPYGNDPDKYRHGTFYFGFGPVEVGWDSEGIRNFVQNLVVHNLIGSPYFKDLRYLPEHKRGRPYIQFGWGSMW